MESPADKVPQGLLKHVHLLSAQQYANTPAQLPVDDVLQMLLNAPRVVGSSKPVSWQYILPPADGTIFLAWQPMAHMGKQFATDGYTYPEPEAAVPQHARGYVMEVLLSDSGFIMGHDTVGMHRRVRYRLITSPNGQPGDQALEIVHYTQSPSHKQLPVQSMNIDAQKQNLQKERSYLEGEGRLNRKEFMLYDKHNWPNISMPGRQAPAVPSNPYQRPGMPSYPGGFPPGMARPPGPPQPFPGQAPGMHAQQMGPSPAKRQKTMPPQPAGMRMPELGPLEEEENSYLGDMLDLLTPREISMTRYKQHHEWMEEILSSAYAVDKILPEELDFQLAGELSELTKDLFAADKGEGEERRIKEEDVKTLEGRVEGYQRRGQQQMASMRAEHKAKMEELSRQQVWIELERRLGKASQSGAGETVEEIMREVEKEGGRRVGPREAVVRVQKGGLMDREETLAASRQRQQQQQQQQQQQGHEGEVPMQGATDEFGEFANLDTAGEALDFYSGDYSNMGYGA